MAVGSLTPAEPQEQTLGAQIRSLRLRAGFSQSDLAAGLCSRTYIAQIEADRRFPKAWLLARLAHRLGTGLEDLAGAYLRSPMVNAEQCLAVARELAVRQAVDMAREALAAGRRLYELEGRPPRLKAMLLEAEGLLRFRLGDLEEARRLLESALALHERGPAPAPALVRARLALGLILSQRGLLDQALQVLMPALPCALTAHRQGAAAEPHGEELWSRFIEALAHLALRLRRPHVTLFILDLIDHVGLVPPSPALECCRALAEVAAGAAAPARERLERVLAATQDPHLLAQAHTHLGVLNRLQGDWLSAQHHLSTAWCAFQRSGAGDGRAIANELARCALAQGHLDQAHFWLQEARNRDEPASSRPAAETHWLAGRLARLRGDVRGAVREWAAAMKSAPGGTAGAGIRQRVRVEQLRLLLSRGRTREALALLDLMETDLEMLPV